MRSQFKELYNTTIVQKLVSEFNYRSVMEAPRLEKIVVNMGVGDAVSNSKLLDQAVEELTLLTGQKPVITKAKKSISNFKLREGQAIGAKVTLRGDRMYYFLEKLVSVALPRVRDFRGVSADAFDGRGNYTLGVKEQIIFPEINIDKVNKVRGMDIIIVTTAQTDQEAKSLLNAFGFPFKK
ncbi:50S ribosomal protein L5 [Acholeplasma granularum]|uniref:50S ribosomal protein L5 n=1 Tax=Acholeplasma granularum TaxID=264635 RepID=UPI0004B7C1D1|nr:50S ribosomal protein L5 [Acholeplasma granularum]